MATSLPWQPFPCKTLRCSAVTLKNQTRAFATSHGGAAICAPRAISRSDFDDFAKRVVSGETLRDAVQSANEGLEQLLYNARKGAERIDRRFALSARFDAAVRSAAEQAKRIDRDYGIGRRWRALSMDFRRNSPAYWRQLNDFLETPLGKSFATLFFLWFALSGWLFRILILATWVLPFAAPLLIGTVANNFVIEGACPACKRRFMGYRNQVIRCRSCQSIVWQPRDDFSRGSSTSTSGPDVIDIEIEEK